MAVAAVVAVDVGADEVGGHQARCERDAVEVAVEGLGEHLDAVVLARPGVPSTSRCPSLSRQISMLSTKDC